MKKIKILFFTIFIYGLSQAQQNRGIKINQNIENDTIPKIVHSQILNYSTIVLLDNNYASLETLDLLNPNSIKSVKIEKGNFEINRYARFTGQ